MAERDPAMTVLIDADTGRRVSRLSRRLNLSEAEVLRDAVARMERIADNGDREGVARTWIASFDNRFPPARRRSEGADKAFFDELGGDD